MDFWKSLTSGFMPHGYCLQWDAPLLFVLIAGNLGIALAYFLIPLALRYFVGKRKDLPYPYMFKLFAAFILACGLTHIVKILTIWQPVYWVEAVVDLLTAVISMVTAILLWPLIPKMLQLRSPKELDEINKQLRVEMLVRDQAELLTHIARDEAIQANKLKSQFIATISHEIRTPLSGVLGLAELIKQSPELADDTREMAKLLFASSAELLEVLNGLLDFSKLEAGRMDLEKDNFSVKALLDEVSRLSQPSANKKGLELATFVDPHIPNALIGDSGKLRQILLNLTHNAVKFTDKGSVKIAAELKSQKDNAVTVRFSVTDTGVGIATDAQGRLFEPFVQADGTIRRQFGGTGLGLSIAKELVRLIAGEIGLSSVEGQGSSFWFTAALEMEPEKS